METSKLFDRVERPALGSSRFEVLCEGTCIVDVDVFDFVAEDEAGGGVGLSSHLCISMAEDVRLLKIELRSVRLPRNPELFLRLVDDRLLVGCVIHGEIMAGCSEPRRQLGVVEGVG